MGAERAVMLVKNLANGQNFGTGPSYIVLNYLLSEIDNKGNPRDPPPELIMGNPVLLEGYIDASPQKYKYTSMVLSFAPEDEVTDAQVFEVIEEVERLAFAGIPKEYWPSGTWVKHTHTGGGRVELHFVYARRLNEPKGRSYNMYPPGQHQPWNALRDKLNAKFNWADPMDPRRRRIFTSPAFLRLMEQGKWPSREILRQEIYRDFEHAVECGEVFNRADVLEKLNEDGYEITRITKSTISVRYADGKQPIKLQGECFRESFEIDELARAEEARGRDLPEERDRRYQDASGRLEEWIEKRTKHNQEAYNFVVSAQDRTHDMAKDLAVDLDINSCLDRCDWGLVSRVLGTPANDDRSSDQSGLDFGGYTETEPAIHRDEFQTPTTDVGVPSKDGSPVSERAQVQALSTAQERNGLDWLKPEESVDEKETHRRSVAAATAKQRALRILNQSVDGASRTFDRTSSKLGNLIQRCDEWRRRRNEEHAEFIAGARKRNDAVFERIRILSAEEFGEKRRLDRGIALAKENAQELSRTGRTLSFCFGKSKQLLEQVQYFLNRWKLRNKSKSHLKRPTPKTKGRGGWGR